MPYQEARIQPSSSLEAASFYEAMLSRYAELVGHTHPLPLPEAADFILKQTRLIHPLVGHSDVSYQLQSLASKLDLDCTRIPPDISIFIHDREIDKPQLKGRFSWSSISVTQSARFLDALSEPINPDIASRLELAIGETYPSVSPILGDQETIIPARFFLNYFDSILSENERLLIETGVRKYHLSPAEYACLILIARGKSNKEIAEIMGISSQTVKNHHTDLFTKFWETDTKVYCRTQATIIAIQEGLFPLSLAFTLPEFAKTGGLQDLSPKKSEVLQLLASGLANKEIALRLGIPFQVIKNHVTGIFRKLRCEDRTEATLICYIEALNAQAESEV